MADEKYMQLPHWHRFTEQGVLQHNTRSLESPWKLDWEIPHLFNAKHIGSNDAKRDG